MLYALRDNDIIVAITNHYSENSYPIPNSYNALYLEQLRYDEAQQKVIVLPDEDMTFYIDENQNMHIKQYNDKWLTIKCKWNDVLTYDSINNNWKVFSTLQKEELVQTIKLYRSQLEDIGILVNNHPQHLTSNDISKITATNTLLASGKVSSIKWRFVDGVFVDMSASLFSQFISFVFKYVEELFGVEQYHVTKVRSLDDSELSSYNYRVGWPSNSVTIDFSGD